MALVNEIYTELFIDGAWVDVSDDVQIRDDSGQISIKRGRANEGSRYEVSSLSLEFNNREGKYSPKNPLSPYFQKLNRNTPIRVRRNDPTGGAPGYSASSTTAEGSGDFSWTHSETDAGPNGVLVFVVESTTHNAVTPVCTYGGVDVPLVISADTPTNPDGGYWCFFLGEGIPGGNQTVTVTGMTVSSKPIAISFFGNGNTTNSTAIDNIPATTTGSTANPSATSSATANETLVIGLLHSGQDAIGSVAPGAGFADILEYDFGTTTMSVVRKTTDSAPGTPTVSWTATADTWSICEIAICNKPIRFVGEVTSWPPRWDVTGNDAWVPIEASGISRRINQGSQFLNGNYKNFLLDTSPVIYWPLDDDSSSLVGTAASGTYKNGFASEFARQLDTTTMDFGSGFLSPTLNPTLRINDTNPGAADFISGLCIGTDVAPDTLTMDWVYRHAPITVGSGMAQWFIRLFTYGTDSLSPNDGIFDLWEVQFRADGTNDDIRVVLDMDAFGVAGGPTVVTLNNSADDLDAILDRELHHCRLQLRQDGADVDYEVWVDGVSVVSGTRASYTLRNSRTVWVLYDRQANEDYLSLGHVIVWQNDNYPEVTETSDYAHSFDGEAAGRRIERQCAKLGIPFRSVGDLDESATMGPEYNDKFLDQIAEVEDTDLGFVYETRDTAALSYRVRTDLYNRDVIVTLDYSNNEIGQPFEPVDDDQNTKNDIFAQRRDGGSFQATKEEGPLSVLDPPDGVGRYKDEHQCNPHGDGQLGDIAGFLLLQGTIDEARFPKVVVNLHHPNIASNDTLLSTLISADVGDRLMITNAAAANMYDDISLVILGYSEVMNKFQHTITFVCAPYLPYEVANYNDEVGGTYRYAARNSVLTDAIDSTDTSFSVDSPETLWTQNVDEFPFDINIGGERMTVSGITSATSPQTFTVTRSVNGVVKSHTADTEVQIWTVARYTYFGY